MHIDSIITCSDCDADNPYTIIIYHCKLPFWVKSRTLKPEKLQRFFTVLYRRQGDSEENITLWALYG